MKVFFRKILEELFRKIPVARAGFLEADFYREKVRELQEERGGSFDIFQQPLLETIFDGLTYLSPEGDFTSAYLQSGQPYEEHVLKPLLEDAKTARNTLDIGANIGLIAMPLARVTSGSVYCLELSPVNAKLLYKNAKRNGLDNIKVFPVAVGDGLDSCAMALNKHTSLNIANQVTTAEQILNDNVHIVPFISIDVMFSDAPPIDLIKVDVDGWDYQVLKGGSRLIERNNPIIYTEYSPDLIRALSESTEEAYLKLLIDQGYRAEILGPFVPRSPAPTHDPNKLAGYIADLINEVTAVRLTHVDIRWARPL